MNFLDRGNRNSGRQMMSPSNYFFSPSSPRKAYLGMKFAPAEVWTIQRKQPHGVMSMSFTGPYFGPGYAIVRLQSRAKILWGSCQTLFGPFSRRIMLDNYHPPSHAPNGAHLANGHTRIIQPAYVGISANVLDDGADIGFALNDGKDTLDSAIFRVNNSKPLEPDHIVELLINKFKTYSHDHNYKFVAIGVSHHLARLSPLLCTRIWKDLDAVPVVLDVSVTGTQNNTSEHVRPVDGLAHRGPLSVTRPVDEQADAAAKKLLTLFSDHYITVPMGVHHEVDVDHGGMIHLIDAIDEYRGTSREPSWNALIKYRDEIRKRGLKAAFFNSTPQGGGVALMRHALIRLFKFLGLDVKWYVPKPSSSVFRVTKNNHNILQGVADPALRLTPEGAQLMTDWIEENAKEFWLCEGGPLAPGGVDIAIIDDPQMPGLIPLIRKARPDIPIIYRSHIEVRSDLIAKTGSPQAGVWDYLYERIRHADVFISHPIRNFIPSTIPPEIVGLLPAATDWLDGLNKDLPEWDSKYYIERFRSFCIDAHVGPFEYPKREYIVQIARFDPAKGIDVAIDAYIKLRHKLEEEKKESLGSSNGTLPLPPQLLLCAHGAVDDPDARKLLNVLLAKAKFALQLSSREGFEIKVSEALHVGKPVIATLAGGIPLQVQDGKNGFLCKIGDADAISRRMHELWTNKDGVHTRMSEYAKRSVSDEVGTVGNAVSWLYLINKMTQVGENGQRVKLEPNGRWINDMAREEAGEPYREGEPRLPRILKV
ncbi:glycosyltransferase family 4 protein [Hydnum rufescens UP504]|uniref:Glycosyltransferase family 4 protein n=1 Tax=Hydnum rufescens UP504 TaxID=1448309 RepID=A0A9P6B1X3_9AGAM|nr:glycosyltransferase family 4 protein [Hydnum rufescens UP504]